MNSLVFSEIFSYHVLLYLMVSIILLFPGVNIAGLLIRLSRSSASQEEVVKSKINQYIGFLAMISIVFVWYLLTIFNYLTFNSQILLITDRLAYSIVPWIAYFLFLLVKQFDGANKSNNRPFITLVVSLTLLISGLVLFDNKVIVAAIPHGINNQRDVAIFGPHAIVYFLLVLLLAIITLVNFVVIFIKIKGESISRQRLKIITAGFVAGFVITTLFNLILPLLGHPELIDYGVIASLFVIYGIYLALEDKWVYSIRYLIAKNFVIWFVGLLLFIVVRGIELLMVYSFHFNLVDLRDYSAQLFGILLGITVAYLFNILYKFSYSWGLLVIYYKYYNFRKEFTRYIHRVAYLKTHQKVAIRHILELILRTLNLEKVCIVEPNGLYVENYTFCVKSNGINKKKISEAEEQTQKLISKANKDSVIKITLMKNRFLYLYTQTKFIPKEFIDLIQHNRSAINALVNWDITDRNLRTLNSKLARAVVLKTQQLNKVINEQKKVIYDLQLQLAEYKQFIPDITFNIGNYSRVLREYLEGILKQTQGNTDLQFLSNRLYENVQSLTKYINELLIFSDVVISKKLDLQQGDIKEFLNTIASEWKLRYENKMVGLIPDIFPEHVKVTADFRKLKFAIDFVLLTMLQELAHGYVQFVARIEGSYIHISITVHLTGGSVSLSNPMNSKDLQDLKKNLQLIQEIFRLHRGVYSQTFENGFLSHVGFTLPISGV